MSYYPSGKEKVQGKPREKRLDCRHDVAETPRTYQPSGQRAERHLEDPGRSEVTPGSHSGFYVGEQKNLALPPLRTHSSSREEKRQPPHQRIPDWHNVRPPTDSETVPAQRRNEVEHTKKETRDVKQPTRLGARVNFQRPVHRRPTPEDADEEEVSGSSTDDSLEGSLTIVEKDGSRLGDRERALSQSLDVIEDEGARTSDEDGYVYVPRTLPLSRST